MAKWKEYDSKQKRTYSDGEVENVIYEYVKNKVDIKEVSREKLMYPILYHLSELRENILNWYPFKKNATVLEVGAGCGAITGMLCRMVAKVVSVDISAKRANINYIRNSQYENLEIVVGNINEIQLTESFDYIILNGVLEYAGMFTDGDSPYKTFLKRLQSYLKPEGTFFIAIENKLGIKYFAGAPEDHTNEYFTGLNGYKNSEVKTFSHKELEKLLLDCGMQKIKFYYPYPDYKFPEEIFTLESIKQYGKRRMFYLQENNFQLFDTQEVCEAFIKEDMMEKFANSFLVEASYYINDFVNDVLYVKINQDRKEEYRICTSIIKNTQGIRYVVKKALCSKAKNHIKRMAEVEKKIKSQSFQYLSGIYEEEENEIYYPYIEGKNLDEEIREIIKTEDFTREEKRSRIFHLLDEWIKVCKEGSYFVENFITKEFCEVFGEEAYVEQNCECICPANIDLILNNVYFGEKYTIIDPEWIFDFPVPTDFIIWRTLNELQTGNTKLEEIIDSEDLMERYRMEGQNKINIFKKWANHFVENYVEGDKAKQWYKSPLSYDLYQHLNKALNQQTVMILYYSYGDGFKEEQKFCSEVKIVNKKFHVEFYLKEINAVEFRFDPAICECRCRLTKVKTDVGKVQVKVHDILNPMQGRNVEVNEWYEFLTDDPQYFIQLSDVNVEKLCIEGEIKLLQNS